MGNVIRLFKDKKRQGVIEATATFNAVYDIEFEGAIDRAFSELHDEAFALAVRKTGYKGKTRLQYADIALERRESTPRFQAYLQQERDALARFRAETESTK